MNSIAKAYLWACNCELDALKPGNVHRHSDGHGMSVADFELSASVSARAVAQRGARVGARIYNAVAATKMHVGKNTNLGIILLCAPIAAAVEQNQSIKQVLTSMTLVDTQDCFAAIALARPGGLGVSPQHDVRATATTHLATAMQLAADRDLVARQYTHNFADVFGLGLSRWHMTRGRGAAPAQAGSDVYLAFLARWPDTHIGRKFGEQAAESVQREAQVRLDALPPHGPKRQALLQEWDADLKAQGLNPGACADLTVATLFTARLMDALPNDLRLFHKSG